MKKITYFLTFSLLLLSFSNTQGQCLTDEMDEKYHQDHPGHHEEVEAMETKISEWTNSNKGNTRRARFIIPVVFHVIHSGGTENISKEQILDQVRVMNEDCQMTNSDKDNLRTYFKDRAANLDIEFRLAKIDENGNCTDGINRVYSSLTVDARDNVKSLPGVQWDYTKYLNIYVVQSIENTSGTAGTILGFAVFPWSTSSTRDGIVIRSDRVGTIGTAVGSGAGRTMTHEIGHWLGLYHPFQGGCTGQGDRVGDTPPVGSTFANANCPANNNSCSNDNPNELDLWENYMDYSSGTCQVMFTAGQKTRSDFFLTSNTYTRRLNVSQANLEATGVLDVNDKPIASFTSNTRVICAGNPVTFYDASCKGQVDTRSWTFEGGDISSTNAESPVITYDQPGKYKVSIMVANVNGSNSYSQEEYIEVRPAEGTYTEAVFETFDKPINELDAFYPVIVGSGGQNFISSTSSGFNSTTSILAPISNATPNGTKFVLESKDLNAKYLRGLPKYVNFRTSYAPDINQAEEELRVYISKDCGGQWEQIFYRPSTALGISTTEVSSFVPTSDADWRRQLISLGSWLVDNDSNYRLRFEVSSQGGNSVYIDNINIGQFLSSVKTLDETTVSMYPNPAKDKLTVEFSAEINTIEIANLLGQVIKSQSIEAKNLPLNSSEINISNLPNGVYMVRFIADNNTFAQKLVVSK